MKMPRFKKLKSVNQFTQYANTYYQCSGLGVPEEYLRTNQVFAIYVQKKMIGGFVLGSGTSLRTIEYFAATDNKPGLYENIGPGDTCTEICCFWIDPQYQNKTMLNYFIWFCLAIALKRYSKAKVVFGTQSPRLAALYGATLRSVLIHKDRVNKKRTFIFRGRKRDSIVGISQILWYKAKRILQVRTSQYKVTESKRVIS